MKIFFQKIIDIKSKSTYAIEVLTRFSKGMDWRLVDLLAVAFLKENMSNLENTIQSSKIFINVSEETLLSPYFNEWIGLVLELNDMKNDNFIVIEITEGVSPATLNRRRIELEHLISTGVQLAMDDFGTCFSNMERLKNYSWSFCKVDFSILNSIDAAELIEICDNKNIKLISEVVENESIASTSINYGVNLLQGFYFHRPEEFKIDKKTMSLITPLIL